MYVADDGSTRVAHGAFRWRSALPLSLIALGAGYSVLVMVPRLSPGVAALSPWRASAGQGIELPFLVQLALALAGLAALVWVLSRAVRAVDTYPYASIAPALAVFSGLVHLGLRVDVPFSYVSSTQLAGGVIALALVGGALIRREQLSAQLFGWMLAVVPCGLVASLAALHESQSISLASLRSLPPSVRVFLQLLIVSALMLGMAGVVARRMLQGGQELGFQQREAAFEWSHLTRAELAEADEYRAAAWNAGRLSRGIWVSAALVAVAVGAYWGVHRLRQRGVAAPALTANAASMAMPPPGLPVVEQLAAVPSAGSSDAAAPHERERSSKHADVLEPKPARSERRAQRTSAAPATAKRDRAAGSRSSRTRGERASRLPAWGTEVAQEAQEVQEARKAAQPDVPLATKPVPVATRPAAVSSGAAASTVSSRSLAGIAKPSAVPVSPPVAPAAPAAPKNEKPLTMDQLLNRVVDVASQQRGGGKATAKSQRDTDLDELLNKAVKPRGR